MRTYVQFHKVFRVVLVIISTLFIGTSIASAQTTTTTLDPYNSADVETAVRSYFDAIPAMAAIGKCESGFGQYKEMVNVIFDPAYSMIGVLQISKIHLPESITMGMDITALDGNMAYAKYLYNQEGTTPWMSSYGCWQN